MFSHHITVTLCWEQLYTAGPEQPELTHLCETFGSYSDFQKQPSELAEKEVKALSHSHTDAGTFIFDNSVPQTVCHGIPGNSPKGIAC